MSTMSNLSPLVTLFEEGGTEEGFVLWLERIRDYIGGQLPCSAEDLANYEKIISSKPIEKVQCYLETLKSKVMEG